MEATVSGHPHPCQLCQRREMSVDPPIAVLSLLQQRVCEFSTHRLAVDISRALGSGRVLRVACSQFIFDLKPEASATPTHEHVVRQVCVHLLPGVFEGVIDDTTSACSGHGTHCASTIGGSTYGVSKGVTVVAVQVLSCGGGGSTSGIM